MQSNITPDDLAKFAAAFDADPKNRLAANAVAQNDIAAVALNRASVNRINHTYSHLIDTPEATDQGATGRCWMFAGLNVLRLAAIQKMNLKDDMVCLINAPTEDKPYNKLYTVAYLGNVVGGQPVRYLNADVEVLKKAAADSIVDGQAVWFGSDVGQMLAGDLGLLDMDVYDYELVYGVPFALDKAGRLDYGHSRMTHAMLLTGVDLGETGRPVKWRVENSWGTEHGDKGYMLMTDCWFEEYLYEIAVSKRYLSPDLLAVLETEPVVLPPWDPMGSLA